MESKDNYEDIALKKSILPVLFYLAVCFAVFFTIDRVSITANNFVGVDYVKLVNILEVLLIALLTTFLIFYLVYKHKFVEINATRNMNSFINTSPNPVFICKLKDYSIRSCSPVMYRLLGYSANEIKSMTLRDIISEASFKILQNEHQNKNYINKDFENIHFIEKSQGLLALSANIMKYELLDSDYLLISCFNSKVTGSSAREEKEPIPQESKRPFQF